MAAKWTIAFEIALKSQTHKITPLAFYFFKQKLQYSDFMLNFKRISMLGITNTGE